MDVLNCILKKLSEICAVISDTGRLHTVRSADKLHITQNHFGIIHEIGVHLDAVFIGSKVYPFGFNVDQTVTLLEEDNIRSDLCTSSSLKGIIRQANRSEKISSLRDILTNSGVLLIHRSF